MAASPRRAVVTGMGVLCALGHDPAAFRAALFSGVSGIGPFRAFELGPNDCRLSGAVVGYDGKKFLPATNREARKSLNKMARTVQFGFTTAVQAWENAGGPQRGQIDPFRFGVEFGCVMVATEVEDLAGGAKVSTIPQDASEPPRLDYAAWGQDGLRAVPPQWMLKYLPNMPACHASIYCDAQGPNNTITNSDIASSGALGEAYRILQRDLADAFLVGGCDSRLNPVSYARLSKFQELTKQNELKAAALQPYGATRDGTILGEGAAVLVVEELALAQARGAKILAEIVGFAAGMDLTRSGEVLAGVIHQALAQANIPPEAVDHVNVAAGGQSRIDAWEARALEQVFGPYGVDIVAPKVWFGSTIATAGLLELAVSLVAFEAGQVPGFAYPEPLDPQCPVRLLRTTRALQKPYALKLSMTELGQCTAIVVRAGTAV